MKIQIYSDLHLEFSNSFPKIKPLSKYLFLCGDIGHIDNQNFKDFFHYCSNNWNTVIFVLGNHEYYHSHKNMNELFIEYKTFCDSFDNIFLLEKDFIILEDWKIIGLTFWSHILNQSYNITNCTKNIHLNNNELGLDNYNQLNQNSIKWLNDNNNPILKTIIITHYPLTQKNILQNKFIHQYNNTHLLNVFSNHFDFNNNEKLILISGHTHFSHYFTDNNITYISNQFGYNDELIYNQTNIIIDGLFTI